MQGLSPYHQRPYPVVEQKGDVGIGCVDPRVTWSGDGGDIVNSSEGEGDDLQTRVEIKETVIKSRGDDRHDVRKHHDGIPSPPPRPVAATTAEWVNYNTPLLQEYAERQISPPLIERVSIELNHPTQFVKGTFQMLSNRNKGSDEPIHPTRRLEHQLLDGFVDIHTFANEYLRSQFDQELVGDLVPVLLTIITNNFYEVHMRLMDDIVRQGLANMDARKGPCLEVEDFVFGFDLHMSQDMPFFVDVNHRVRDTLERLRPKSSESVTTRPREPQTTRYGRTTKPTQQLAESGITKTQKSRGKKKAEQAEVVVERDNEAVTPKTELPSTTGRPRKPRARATPKPKNPKQPEASTSSTVNRRPRQSVFGRGKVPRNPVRGHVLSPSVMASRLPESSPLIVGPVIGAAVTPESFAPSITQFQASKRAPPNMATVVNGTAAPWPSISFGHDTNPLKSAALTDGHELSPQLQAPTSSVTHSHVPHVVSQPLPSTSFTDAQLFDFITWPTEMATSTVERSACEEGSHSRCSTLLSKDYRGANPTASEVNPQQLQASGSDPLKSGVVEHPPQWEKSLQEPERTLPSADDATFGCQSTSGRSTINDADAPQLQPIPPFTTLLTNVRISEVAKQEGLSPSPNPFITESLITTLSEVNSPMPSLAPTPVEGQTPDMTLAGYDSDATDGTVSTLVTSYAPTPKINSQRLKPTRRTPGLRTPEPTDDRSSSQRLTIKLPMQTLACADTASTSELTQSRTLTASRLQPQRGLGTPRLVVQIPPSCSGTEESSATTKVEDPQLSPLSTLGAVKFSPEPVSRVTKKRKLGKVT